MIIKMKIFRNIKGLFPQRQKATKIIVAEKKTNEENHVEGFADAFENFLNEKGVTDVRMRDFVNQIRNADRKGINIDKDIDEIVGNDYRPTTIRDWLVAMRAADQPYERGYQSSWVEIFNLYANLIQDSHVEGAIEALNEGVLSKDFFIVDEKGERLDEVTKLFQRRWFADYAKAEVNVRLWGFSLIQFINFDPKTMNIQVEEVNRKHVRPDLGGLVKQQYDQEVWRKWDDEPYNKYCIYRFEKKLGKLNKCLRWFIYKNDTAKYWALFNKLYGIPPIASKTSLKDNTRKNNMIKMLKNWVNMRWIVMDKDDELMNVQPGSANGHQFFLDFLEFCNKEMSKALMSSTMLLDAEGGQYKADAHQDTTNNIIQSICRSIMYSMNENVIPRLIEIGFPIPKGAQFMWDKSEKLKMTERATVISTLSNKYDIDPKVVTEFVGVEVKEKKEVEQDPFKPNPGVMKNAFNNYKNNFDHE